VFIAGLAIWSCCTKSWESHLPLHLRYCRHHYSLHLEPTAIAMILIFVYNFNKRIINYCFFLELLLTYKKRLLYLTFFGTNYNYWMYQESSVVLVGFNCTWCSSCSWSIWSEKYILSPFLIAWISLPHCHLYCRC
jgi:hypothetical protein